VADKSTRFDRILVIDPNLATAKMLATMLRSVWPSANVYGAQDTDKAMLLAGEIDPQLIFVEAAAPGLNGMAFTRAFRRSDLIAREAPIIMVFGEVKAAQVLEARDSGVHEFLRRPISMGDLQRRLEAVSGPPRDWIEAVNYVGPDRRRFASAEFDGPSKRRTDGTQLGKINQALRIIQSASRQLDSDSVQAARALATQCRVLIELSAGQTPLRKLHAATTALQAYLQTTSRQGAAPVRAQIESFAASIIQAAPEKARPAAA
jgi:DNA-binding response OmpR family regulator